MLAGGLMLCPEVYLLTSGIASGSSTLARLLLVDIPAVIGLLCLLVGAVRMMSALRASLRIGLDAIDLTPTEKGPLVRGGALIPWKSLTDVTVTVYGQLTPLSFFRSPADVNVVLELRLEEPRAIPRLTPRRGADLLTISLVHYPAVGYLPLLESLLEDIERRGIPIEVRAGLMDHVMHAILELALIPTH